MPSSDRAERRPIPTWLAAALWTALVLTGLRAGLLFLMERLGHGDPLALVRLRLATTLPGIAAVHALAGLLAAGVGTAVLRPGKGARATLFVLCAGALFACLVSGWPLADASRRIGLYSTQGQAAAAAVLLASFALAALLVTQLRTARGFGLPLALLVLGPLSLRLAWGEVTARMPVHRVAHELLADLGRLQVVRAHPASAPRVEVLAPSKTFGEGRAELPTLVLAPGSEVKLPLPADAGALWLVARTGIDARSLDDTLAGRTLRFELLVDGEERAVTEHDLAAGASGEPNTWQPVGGTDGLFLAGGSELTLRTELLAETGAPVPDPPPLLAGFAELVLERRWEVERTQPSPEHPNLVVVVMDTLRADRLATYGYGAPTSPHLDRLAARGLVFEEAYSTASWTWPATASLFTGLAPEEHGVVDARRSFLTEALTTLPERLQDAGYSTAAWTANPLIARDKNFDQGFELFDDPSDTFRATPNFWPEVLEWLGALRDTRFFLYLHLVDTHFPHRPSDEARALFLAEGAEPTESFFDYTQRLLRGEGHLGTGALASESCVPPADAAAISAAYDACVHSADRWLGSLTERLDELGLTDETVVVYTSDHGEELLDHGLYGHGNTLHAELVRIPLVLAGPGLPHGVRSSRPVSLRALPGTLLALAGVDEPELGDAGLLWPEPPGEAGQPALLYSTRQGWWNGRYQQPLFGVRRGEWVLHWAPEGTDWGTDASTQEPEGGQVRLYRADDTAERVDLSAENPAVVTELRTWLEEHLAELAQRNRAADVEAGPRTLELLRDIGYLGD